MVYLNPFPLLFVYVNVCVCLYVYVCLGDFSRTAGPFFMKFLLKMRMVPQMFLLGFLTHLLLPFFSHFLQFFYKNRIN